MTDTSPPFDLGSDALQRAEARLRPIVRALVGDARADDVLQETWLRALRRSPRDPAARASWLRRIAINVAHSMRRDDARRRRHEDRVAEQSPGVEPAAAEAVERLQVQRAVVSAILELPEPYRSTVVLRYDGGLEIAEIAQQAGVSEANVRQRLRRGLQRVRDKLRAELGRDWRRAPALLAIGWPRGGAAPPPTLVLASSSAWLGVLVMNKVRAALVLVLVTALGGLGWAVWPRPATVMSEVGAAAAPQHDPGTAPAASVVDTSVAEPRRSLAAEAPAGSAPQRWEGAVVDSRGRPLAGVEVGIRPRGGPDHAVDPHGWVPLAETATDGGFAVSGPLASGRLDVAKPWVAVHVRGPDAGDWQTGPWLVVVARAFDVRGTVTDAEGVPLEGAQVRCKVGDLLDFPRALDQTVRRELAPVRAGARGEFRLPAVPVGLGRLEISKAGYRAATVPVTEATPATLTVVLEPAAAAGLRIEGTVTDPRGSLVPGAIVQLGARRTESDAAGRYRLELAPGARVRSGEALLASMPGWRAAVIADFGARVSSAAEASLEQDLQLPGPALRISGRVLFADGTPVVGAAVFPWGETPVVGMQLVEDLAAPADIVPLDLSGPSVRAVGRTDDAGRFEVPGLTPRDYRLRVLHREQGWGYTAPSISGGAEAVVVQLPADLFGEVSGRVVTRDGAPAGTISIEVHTRVYETSYSVNWVHAGRTEATDAEGRFRLEDFPRAGVQLEFMGDGFVPEKIDLEAGVPTSGLEVVLARRCHVRVDLADPALASARIHFEDASGNKVPIRQQLATSSSTSSQHRLQDGKSKVVSISEEAVVMVARQDEQVVRVPLALEPSGVTLITQ